MSHGHGETLRIVSYNIWNINGFDNNSYFDRMRRLLNQIKAVNPDIIALQEVLMYSCFCMHRQAKLVTVYQQVRHDALRDSQPVSISKQFPSYQYVYQAAMSYPEQIFGRVEVLLKCINLFYSIYS
jgi:endonuclease/exonuclease/phosphatase family metal-dependent hydrolase